MTSDKKYNFSFTGISLRLNEMITVAAHQDSDERFDVIHAIGGGKKKTARSIYDEIIKRLAVLTPSQKKLLISGDLISQKQMAFLAVCKSHAFIRDFTVEVLREKFLLFDDGITEGEYYTFLRRKAELHPEIEKLTEQSLTGVRTKTYKILEEAGLIDSVKLKNIQYQFLSKSALDAIVGDNPDWLKIFLMSDTDILNAKKDNEGY